MGHSLTPSFPFDGTPPQDRGAPNRDGVAPALTRVAASLPHLVHVFDVAARRFVYLNRDPEAFLGHTRAQLEAMGGELLERLVHPEDLGRILEHVRRVASADEGDVHELAFRVRRRDGEVRWLRSRDTPMQRDPGGTVTHVLGVAEDRTDVHRLEQALVAANARLTRNAETLERFQQQVEVLSELGELLQSAQSEDELFDIAAGYARRIFPGRSGFFATLSAPRDRLNLGFGWGPDHPDEWLLPEDCWAIRRGRAHSAGPDLEPIYCRHHPPGLRLATACVPLQAQGEVLGVFSVWSHLSVDLEDPSGLVRLARSAADVLELAMTNLRLRVRLEAQAMRDPLTGLFNRRYMEENLRGELLRARRRGSTVAMLVLDLDHFKRLNDARGHDAGDEVLRHVSQALATAVRGADVACRYGGEEFALVLVDCDDEFALRRAEELRVLVQSLRIFYQGEELEPVTVSAGVATSAMDRRWNVRELFRAADLALYAAKRAGRNQVRRFDLTMAPPPRLSEPPASRVQAPEPAGPVSVVTVARGSGRRGATDACTDGTPIGGPGVRAVWDPAEGEAGSAE